MATTNIYSDQSRQVNWVVRQNTDVSLTLTVTESASAYDLSSSTFIAEIFKIGSSTALLTLTEGSGITNGGATGILTLALTNTQLNITADQYWWRLRTTAPTDHMWFNGVFDVNGYLWDGSANSSATIDITIGDTNIDLALTIGGADSLATLGTTLQTAAADTPLDADTSWFYDAAEGIIKLWTWATQKATLKTYFDTIYTTTSAVATQISTALSGYLTAATAASTYQALVNSPTVITDGAAISLTTAEHTLSTAQATITVTDSYTGDYCGLRLTLSGITQVVLTFATGTALCAFGGTASGDNTMTVTGAAGDRVEIHRKKLGTNYTYVGLNVGQ